MSTKISMKDLEPDLQSEITAAGAGTVTQVNQKKPDAEGIVTIVPKDIEAVSEYGGKLGGDYFFEGEEERVLGFKGADGMHHGFFFKPAGMGIYDWVNGRNVFNYDGEENVINITTGSLDINGVPTSVEGHTHAIDDVAGLQTALNNAYNMAKEFGIGGPAKQLPAGFDLNTIRTTGVYMGTGLLNANIAVDQWAFYIHLEHNQNYALQIELPLANENLVDNVVKRHLLDTQWKEWKPFGGGGSTGGGGEYVHVGDFKANGTTYGLSRFDVSKYRKVKFFIDGIQKDVYAADTVSYPLELELWSPLGTTNTHTQRIDVGTAPSGVSADRLRLLTIPADTQNYLPYKLYGEVEINLEDPSMFTTSRMYYLNNQTVTGVSDDTSGRVPTSMTTLEGWRTYHRQNIPQHVTFRYSNSMSSTMGRIRMYGIPR